MLWPKCMGCDQGVFADRLLGPYKLELSEVINWHLLCRAIPKQYPTGSKKYGNKIKW